MSEALVGIGVTYLVGFSAWIVNAIYARPTKPEVYRIEDKILKEMNEMEKRITGEIRASN